MRIVERVDTLLESVQAAQRDAEMWFGDDTVYMERFLQTPRHVEVQILAGLLVLAFLLHCNMEWLVVCSQTNPVWAPLQFLLRLLPLKILRVNLWLQ